MTSGVELHSAIRSLEGNETPDYDQLIKVLHQVRETRATLPELVYKHGSDVLSRFLRKLPLDELWQIREEVAVAALHVGEYDTAGDLIRAIHRQFPDSVRANRLMGMHHEATGHFERAEALYAKELDKNPENELIRRRMAAVKEARGDLFGAIQYLKEYLAVHMVDVVAWEHIATMYLRVGALPQAVFCLEEVIMHQPGNINALLLLAETLYAAGGDANLAASRGYFTGVIEVSGGRNVRALYGACACAALAGGTKKAGGSQKGQGSKGDEGAKELGRLAGEALLQRYGVSAEAKLPLVKAMLTSQGLL